MAFKRYIPQRRDVVWLDFEPTRGIGNWKIPARIGAQQSRVQPQDRLADLLPDKYQHSRRRH